ncbi:hypothetical protein SORBI_3009G132650 [Sorghum bicolor]|uniref:Uncharacterized protein n=1 Tax=Sorghum bicolor TaxID=4558 RepID=A0A1Z5R362_SORBI|nr:hypothetical protein SORBI_3009G132650 [Sorghum bicolor]
MLRHCYWYRRIKHTKLHHQGGLELSIARYEPGWPVWLVTSACHTTVTAAPQVWQQNSSPDFWCENVTQNTIDKLEQLWHAKTMVMNQTPANRVNAPDFTKQISGPYKYRSSGPSQALPFTYRYSPSIRPFPNPRIASIACAPNSTSPPA